MKHIKLFEDFINEKKKGLWANVWAKRKRGEKPAKPGDKDYPDEDAWDAAQESEILESEESYSDYPKAASANAKKALEWRDKYGRDEVDAGTAVGWQRANQLAKGEAVSRDVVSRMAQFNRHRKNSSIDSKFKETPWKDRGYVAWLIWGGDEGVDWAMAKMDQIKKEEVKENFTKAKMFEEFVNETVKGAEVWKHIVSITPEKDMIPTGFKKDIVGRTFKNVDNFDIKSLLKTDPDFKEYYKSGEERYDEDEVNPKDISNEIVVVDGTLLDGYSRVSTLLRNGEKTTYAYVAEKMNEDIGQIFSDGMDQTLRTGYKVELMSGDTGVIIDLIGADEAIVLLGNGVTARVNPQCEIKQIIDTTEPTKSNGRFMS